MIKAGKRATQLPNRAAVNDLQKRSTIVDYAKASPMSGVSQPNLIRNLAVPPKRR